MTARSAALLLLMLASTAHAQLDPIAKGGAVGPFNAELPAGGDQIVHPAQGYAAGDTLAAARDWTLSAWIKPEALSAGPVVIAAIGRDMTDPGVLALVSIDGRPGVRSGTQTLAGRNPLVAGRWSHVAARRQDGRITLFVNGIAIATAAAGDASPAAPSPATPSPATPSPAANVILGPRALGSPVYAGKIAGFTLVPQATADAALITAAKSTPDEDLTLFENGSPTWPLQVKQQLGESHSPEAWLLPKGRAAFSTPHAKPLPTAAALVPDGDGHWSVNGWRLAAAPDVAGDGASLSLPGQDVRGWHVATVPGTVLTTLVDRGVYPDPTIGLNNFAIPEKLARQHYWYRTEFVAPAAPGLRQSLRFDGVNYEARIWLNGAMLGTVKGAFVRGLFDVTGKLRAGQPNAVAVEILPQPHTGFPHEQSQRAGRGPNGGIGLIDGPTFHASEGWDWIPGIRDRNTGLWQGVSLIGQGPAALGDPRITTTLPHADNRLALVDLAIPVTNHAAESRSITVVAAFDAVSVEKTVTLAPGATATVAMSPAEFPQLAVANPRLWWPNGYGDPALHDLRLTARVDGGPSDVRTLRFGMREVTYEMSAMDPVGHVRRVAFSPARAPGAAVIDQRHEAIRKTPEAWVPSLVAGGETSQAIAALPADPVAPYLVLRVNGVRIAARGGNIGMDDLMKRTDRARQEPFFRIQRDAHVNIVRNWMGQSTEESFFALADEYGLMVLDDFWASTQDANAEPEDVPLFLANARDTIRRFQTHPSIIAWIGRNEGVPQPILNQGLQDLARAEDGTRLYMANSRAINLAGSGPYDWREPETYFTEHAKGFAVEIGTPSFPTLESWKRAIPKEDLWPINDSWAYHDWHPDRNGSVRSFMAALAVRFGEPTGLEDFERKAQMLEYESYRAIFEGLDAGLWRTTSGRMLWMTQPAWPSSHWQMFSSDYDTHGAYYGAKKGMEPLHVQMNLPDHAVVLTNTTRQPRDGVTVTARVTALDGRAVMDRSATLGLAANATATVFPLDLAPALSQGPVLVRLEARDAAGTLLSDNFYWQASKPEALRAMNAMPSATLTASATVAQDDDERQVTAKLSNATKTPALATKLTLWDAKGQQILPAYFSDNYVSLLPGETRTITIRVPAGKPTPATISLRGWNIAPARVRVAAEVRMSGAPRP